MESIALSLDAATIPQAAGFLNVTTKTIRNYITKGILVAEKWNGAWRIPSDSLLAVQQRRLGIPPKVLSPVDRKPVESPLPESDRADGAREAGKQAGRLEYAEKTLNDLKKDNQKLRNRVEQLEASTASGWTELRFMKSELLEANQRLSEIREEKDQLEANLKEADVNLGASRRTAASAAAEKDRIAEWFKEEQEERRTLDERYAEIKALYRQALLGNKP